MVLQVHEFDQIPIICKRDGRQLKQGQIYTRSMAKPESSAAITQNELRELLNLASEKQTRRFIETAERAGLQVRADPDPTEGYRRQTIEWERAATRVLAIPHLHLSVRPVTFNEHRVEYPRLLGLAQEVTVRMRGWPLPFIERPGFGDDWVGEESEGREGESWRLHESGLFLHAQAIETHFEAEWPYPGGGKQTGQNFPAWLPVVFFTEAFTLAARLQLTLGEYTPLQVDVAAENIEGWTLVAGNPRRSGFHSKYTFRSPCWRRSIELTAETALTGVRDLAVEYAVNLLQRFGWTGATTDMVQGMQEEVFGTQQ